MEQTQKKREKAPGAQPFAADDSEPSSPPHLLKRRCGYIALLGRPNAGKSTLLNALVGTKLVGVSRKPETTRHRILGIHTTEHTQMLFLDTPGLHPPHRHTQAAKKNVSHTLQFLHRGAMSALGEADLIFYLIDLCQGAQDSDVEILTFLLPRLLPHTRLEVLLSQCDRIPQKARITPQKRITALLQQLSEDHPLLREPRCFSSKIPQHIAQLKKHITQHLPVGDHLYAKEARTDRSDAFIIAEIIREQIFRCTAQELPYATKVEAAAPRACGSSLRCDVDVIVGKKSHKGMIIGKGGSFIKKIGTQSRILLEAHFKQKIILKLWVKVEKRWQELHDRSDDFTL